MAFSFLVGRYVSYELKELKDMTGKVVFVSGGNHGAGYATVKFLALSGATVYLGSRSEARGVKAVKSVEEDVLVEYTQRVKAQVKTKGAKEVVKPGKVIYHHCDIGTPAQAKESAQQFIEREGRLDVLVSNAALLANNMADLDQIVTTNHFGTFQFIVSLLPLLLKTSAVNPDVRIVTVASESHYEAQHMDSKIRFKTYEDFYPDFSSHRIPSYSIYGRTKLMNVLLSHALQRKVISQQAEKGIPATHQITCLAVHPGGIDSFTDGVPSYLRWLVIPLVRIVFVSPDKGSYTSVFAAAGKEIEKDKGKYEAAYLIPTQLAASSDLSRNIELQDELWESTVKFLENWPMKKPGHTDT